MTGDMTGRSLSSSHTAGFNLKYDGINSFNNIEKQVKLMKISDYYDPKAESILTKSDT